MAKSHVGYHPTHGKFNRCKEALDAADLYNFPKNGYGWCDIFYGWRLMPEFGAEVAKAL